MEFVLIVGMLYWEGELGPMDEAILRSIHRQVPAWATGFFRWVTVTGSAWFLGGLTAVTLLLLGTARRGFEAVLLGCSAIASVAIVSTIKAAVGRTRPLLRDTDWHEGASFPSGHTLATAAIASALVICVARLRPSALRLAVPVAGMWIALVASSRLVLGVHWPSDVLTAACLGIIIPFLLQTRLHP